MRLRSRNRQVIDMKLREPTKVTLDGGPVRVNHEGRLLIDTLKGTVTLHTKDRPLFAEDIPEGSTMLYLPYCGEVLAFLKDGEEYDGSSKLSLAPSPRTRVPFPASRETAQVSGSRKRGYSTGVAGLAAKVTGH